MKLRNILILLFTILVSSYDLLRYAPYLCRHQKLDRREINDIRKLKNWLKNAEINIITEVKSPKYRNHCIQRILVDAYIDYYADLSFIHVKVEPGIFTSKQNFDFEINRFVGVKMIDDIVYLRVVTTTGEIGVLEMGEKIYQNKTRYSFRVNQETDLLDLGHFIRIYDEI